MSNKTSRNTINDESYIIRELKNEVNELSKENETLRSKVNLYNRGLGWFFWGGSVTKSLEGWFTEFNNKGKIPKEETGKLVASLIRRSTFLASIGFIVALLPIAVLSYQTYVLNSQNKILVNNLKHEEKNYKLEITKNLFNADRLKEEEFKEYLRIENKNRNTSEVINFSNINLDNINLPWVEINGADFRNSSLKDSFLDYATLLDVDFESSNLSHAKLSDANLDKVNFKKTKLLSVDFRNSKMRNVVFNENNISGSNFSNVVFTNRLWEVYGVDVSFRNTDMSKLHSLRATFINADFSKSKLNSAGLNGVNFADTNFDEANLEETNFLGSLLAGANFDNANLKNAIFDWAIINGADFRNAKNLDPKSLEKACFNPNGITVILKPYANSDEVLWSKSYKNDVYLPKGFEKPKPCPSALRGSSSILGEPGIVTISTYSTELSNDSH